MSNQPSDEQRTLFSTSRRRFLGAAALTGAVATVGAFEARSQEGTQTDEIHPVYGFPAASGDVSPPVDPDHEVTLDIRPVEGRERPEFLFDPVGLAVEAGDVVRFTNALGAHTVTAYHPELERTLRVPNGANPYSSPLLATGSYWLYRFDQPGIYDMYCIPHEEFGMVGRVMVGEPPATGTPEETATGTETTTAARTGTATETGTETTPSPTGTPTTGTETGTPEGTPTEPPSNGEFDLPQFPPTEAAMRVFDDPLLAPENIVEQGSVAWSDLSNETRGLPTTEEPTEQTFTVDLSGENQVPPVDTEAVGEGVLTLSGTSLDYEIGVSDIEDVTQAHIHEGAADENGPVLYTLVEYTGNVDGSGEGQPRSIIGDNVLVIEGTVEDVDPTLFETPETLYVNVHTVDNPSGEIRGQLMDEEATPTETPSGETPTTETETGTPSGETETATGTGTATGTETTETS
ncbi:CHRD domain-containing protein [Halorarius litoreus]|uniref:CHRD domain-containing protein n=1 Tax=Halorarius litoreus TaxID=2962676 RepID=UPI0020CEE068|nr:CHRD domain-containing protein [Halorarius litoreus]